MYVLLYVSVSLEYKSQVFQLSLRGQALSLSELFLSHLVPTTAGVMQWEHLGYLHAQPTTGSFQLSQSFMSSATTLSIPHECNSAGMHRTLCRHNMQHLAAVV